MCILVLCFHGNFNLLPIILTNMITFVIYFPVGPENRYDGGSTNYEDENPHHHHHHHHDHNNNHHYSAQQQDGPRGFHKYEFASGGKSSH